MKSGGVACLSREGCRPERLRRCVNLNTLRCMAREGDGDEDTAVTEGSDGQDQDASSNDDDNDDGSICDSMLN